MVFQRLLQEPQGLRPDAVQVRQLGGGTSASWLSRVYPAAVRARVAGAPMFPGRPASDDVMCWMVQAEPGRRVASLTDAACAGRQARPRAAMTAPARLPCCQAPAGREVLVGRGGPQPTSLAPPVTWVSRVAACG
jgi:hypothetical protein